MRKYIMVQAPEPTPPNSEARKAGYNTIADIGKERIRRAAKKIKEETGADIDYGFRVFKVDDSNMKDTYFLLDKWEQFVLDDVADPIKEDRTDLDLLFGCVLELALPLTLPFFTDEIDGATVYIYGNNLVACFAKSVSKETLTTIALNKPPIAVFRESCFADSSKMISAKEIFKKYSPNTKVKVL